MKKFHNYPFSRTLGWSHSRYGTFTSCKRSYFLRYYSKFVPKADLAKVAFLKSLTTVPMELGSFVHNLIEILLQKIQHNQLELDMNKLEKYIDKEIAENYALKNYAEKHYGQIEFDAAAFKDRALTKFNVFYTSELYQELKQKALSGETNPKEWIIEPSQYGETRIAGNKAYCVVDFAMPTKDKVVIFDWKTGQEKEDHVNQVMAYAVTAKVEYGFDPKDVVTEVVYVGDTALIRKFHDPPVDVISEFEKQVKVQTDELYTYCSDIRNNKPLPIDQFPLTEDLSKCKYCSFKEYCNRQEGPKIGELF